MIFAVCLALCPIFVSAEQIDINAATVSQLDKLIGIGPAYAQRIIDGRPYSSIDDLLRVKGIGPTTLKKIKDQGWACVNCQASPTAQETNQPQTTPAEDRAPTADKAKQTTATPAPAPAPAPAKTYPSGVVFNEILPSPEGPDDKEEWIEIFNQNNFDVDLGGWKIRDSVGQSNTYVFPDGEKIKANGYLVLARTTTKITLNNDGDNLSILDPNDKIIDAVAYEKSPLNESYNRTPDSWLWSENLTPGSANDIPDRNPETGTEKSQKSETEKPETASLINKGLESGKAEIGAKTANAKNTLFLFFVSSALAVLSGLAIFLLKKKIKKSLKKYGE